MLVKSSCLLIYDLRLAKHFIAEVFTQAIWGVQVYRAAKNLAQFIFYARESDKADTMTRFELDEYVHVTFRREIIA